jgi:hypothetical protein
MADGGTPQTWQLRYKGQVYDENSLTVAECEQLEDRLGVGWLSINPVRSATQARVILAHLHAARTGATFDEVSVEVGALTRVAFLEDVWHMVDTDLPGSYIDGNPPVAAAET